MIVDCLKPVPVVRTCVKRGAHEEQERDCLAF